MDGLLDVTGSNIFSNIGKIVSNVAPLIGGVLGGPLASVGINLLSHAFGVDSKNPSELLSKIQTDPEATLKIKTVEYEHAATLAIIANQNYATEVEDREDARKYGINYKDFLRHMAYLVTIGFFLALFALFIPVSLSPEERNLLSMLVGMLASKWQTIIDFFFGSSRHTQHSSK